jgi:hypothetical protein
MNSPKDTSHAPRLTTYALLSLTVGLGSWVLHDALAGSTDPALMADSQPVVSTQPEAIHLTITAPAGAASRKGLAAQAREKKRGMGPQATTLRVPVPVQGTGSSLRRLVAAPFSSSEVLAPWGGRPHTVRRAVGHGHGHSEPVPGNPSSPSGSRTDGYQILATQGSIVFVGDDGRLIANTGHTDSSGVVALGVTGSTLETGTSAGAARPSSSATAGASPGTSSIQYGANGNAALASLLDPDGSGGQSVVLSGLEDHSVSVAGNDQIVTYDDSNVFVARNGQINANTGDTDSSGLNVVDVTGSRVRSGNSGDGEASGEEEEDEGTGAGLAPAGSGRSATMGDAEAGDTGLSSGASTGEDDDGVVPAVLSGMSFGTVTDEGASTAIGRDTLVIGADGYDDVSIRSQGDRNIVSYDDSNVVIGGTGNVNAQIGDSDTGGAVVMGVHDSDVQAGCEGDLCYPDRP